MKLSILFLLPAASIAFAPARFPGHAVAPMRSPNLVFRNELDDACETVVGTTEDLIGKADDLALSRVMRAVDHAPMIFTLRALCDKAGISAKMWSVSSNPSAFAGLTTALTVPTWCFHVWALIAVAQMASVTKSVLAADANELSQADITANSAANFMAARAIGSANPLQDTLLAALVSGYALRKGSGGGAVTVHKAAMQLMSSFTSILAILGLVSAASARIPLLCDQAQLINWIGISAYYAIATRSGNGTVRKAVNAGVAGGIIYSTLQGGLNLSLNVGSIATNIGVVGMAYVAYESINRLRKAVME